MPVYLNKIQAYEQKSEETVYKYYNQLHIIFKVNSGLSSDVNILQLLFIWQTSSLVL